MENPALSTKALKSNYNENRNKFNGIEYDTAFGFDEYEAEYRDYDPQIGRFTQIDPKVGSAESWSVYSGMLDNPILNTDPLGDSVPKPNAVDQTSLRYKISSAIINFIYNLIGDHKHSEPENKEILITNQITNDLLVAQGGLEIAEPGSTGAEENAGNTQLESESQTVSKEAESTAALAGKPKGMANPVVAEALGIGKRAHADFSAKIAEKGWDPVTAYVDPATGLTVFPDAVTPSGHPLELKPATPTGIKQGAKQIIKYERALGTNGRVVYYDPNHYRKK